MFKIETEMDTNQSLNYHRIAEAITYIKANFKDQPNLDEVAEKVHLSSFHFQRLFREWAGTSPKKFLQFISLEHAKKLLKEDRCTLSDTAYETGLSGSGRLHDLFIKIEGMTPAEYKNGGKNLVINYSFASGYFGNLLLASTSKGVCHLAFYDNESDGFQTLRSKFPEARFERKLDSLQQNALIFFQRDWDKLDRVKLHLKGTDFQLKVWEALLKIPGGNLTSYQKIAAQIGKPHTTRAVGTAIGSNPVAFLIPCHRVIQASGSLGGYRWGEIRKTALIGWESSKFSEFEDEQFSGF